MNSEDAVIVGQHLAASIREARISQNTGSVLTDLDRLLLARGTTAIDALAFLALVRTFLGNAIAAIPRDDDATSPHALVLLAGQLVERAVEALEIDTGYGVESFNGDSGVVN